ncbi:hypothetical protein JZ751_020088 [Albula glossodonta]|uniref:PDZ domain-containing protein n=1 Tax=Albula glossodonta TaxID=121402 RepID=A0A8T2NKH7_9TELE|nr:hypothetical protein JZ751_020088 [Albula glossodonta]
MSLKGFFRQNSHGTCSRESSLRNKGSPWQRRSFNKEGNSKHLQNVDTSFGAVPRGRKQATFSWSNSLLNYTDQQRIVVILEKQDNEVFGFEIQTYGLLQKDNNALEMCTFVSKVQEHSPAENAGLTTGDVIVTVNGICTEGSSHQHIVDLIQKSNNLLMMETMSGTMIKRIELEKKLTVLKQSLREKLVELRALTLQEQRLIRGNLNDCPPLPNLDSPVPLCSPTGRGNDRLSSVSSCRSMMTVDSEDIAHLSRVSEDMSPVSPFHASTAGEDCFFSDDFSSSGQTPCTSPGSASGSPSLYQTLPRRAWHGSVRKRFMKFIPGLNRSVEEDENQ